MDINDKSSGIQIKLPVKFYVYGIIFPLCLMFLPIIPIAGHFWSMWELAKIGTSLYTANPYRSGGSGEVGLILALFMISMPIILILFCKLFRAYPTVAVKRIFGVIYVLGALGTFGIISSYTGVALYAILFSASQFYAMYLVFDQFAQPSGHAG